MLSTPMLTNLLLLLFARGELIEEHAGFLSCPVVAAVVILVFQTNETIRFIEHWPFPKA